MSNSDVINIMDGIVSAGDTIYSWFKEVSKPLIEWWKKQTPDRQIKTVAYTGTGLLFIGGLFSGSMIIQAGVFGGIATAAGIYLIYMRFKQKYPSIEEYIGRNKHILEITSMLTGFFIGLSGGIQGAIMGVVLHVMLSSMLSTF